MNEPSKDDLNKAVELTRKAMRKNLKKRAETNDNEIEIHIENLIIKIKGGK
ncbi:MAG: hypothetical protein ACFFDN_50860 [Candidatus Hodarchaeota archaeon]